MDTSAPKAGEIEGRIHPDRAAAGRAQNTFEALSAGELLWQPYRSMSRMLLNTHQNIAAYMQVNRALTDELQQILRRAQDMVMQMSERGARRAHESAESHDHNALISLPIIEEMYEFAINGVRDLGGATVAAHIRSLEALREHARSVLLEAPEAPVNSRQD